MVNFVFSFVSHAHTCLARCGGSEGDGCAPPRPDHGGPSDGAADPPALAGAAVFQALAAVATVGSEKESCIKVSSLHMKGSLCLIWS